MVYVNQSIQQMGIRENLYLVQIITEANRKWSNNDLQNTTQKTRDWAKTNPTITRGGLRRSGGQAVSIPLVASIVLFLLKSEDKWWRKKLVAYIVLFLLKSEDKWWRKKLVAYIVLFLLKSEDKWWKKKLVAYIVLFLLKSEDKWWRKQCWSIKPNIDRYKRRQLFCYIIDNWKWTEINTSFNQHARPLVKKREHAGVKVKTDRRVYGSC
jgi:hypothetical protein